MLRSQLLLKYRVFIVPNSLNSSKIVGNLLGTRRSKQLNPSTKEFGCTVNPPSHCLNSCNEAINYCKLLINVFVQNYIKRLHNEINRKNTFIAALNSQWRQNKRNVSCIDYLCLAVNNEYK